MRSSRTWALALIPVTTFACSGEVHSVPAEKTADSGVDAMPTCPPTGPFGVNRGEVAPDVTLYDCDGSPVHLHDLCPNRAAYLVTHAGWCGTCKLFVQSGEANALFHEYENDGLKMWLVITATESDQPPTMETCRAYRDEYGLDMTVLIDPDGVTGAELDMLPNSDDMVLSQGNVIELNGSWAPDFVESKLDELFGR